MAEKFDIAEHIKVEALGERYGEIIDEDYFRVNNKIYSREDYTLNFTESGATPKLNSLQIADPNFFVIYNGQPYSYKQALVVFKAPVDGFYRVTDGGTAPSSWVTIPFLNAGDWHSVTIIDANFNSNTRIAVDRYETYIDEYGYTRSRSLGLAYITLYTIQPFTAGGGYYEGDQHITTPAVMDGNVLKFKGIDFMVSDSALDSTLVKYKIGVSPGQGYEYPQFYVEPSENEYSHIGSGETIRHEYNIELPAPAGISVEVKLYAEYSDSSSVLLATTYYGYDSYLAIPTSQALNYPLANFGTIDVANLWEGPSEGNEFTFTVTPGYAPGTTSYLGGQQYWLTYQPVSDYTGTTATGNEVTFYTKDTPNATDTIFVNKNLGTPYPDDSHYLIRSYEEYYVDYNFVVTETILRPDLVSNVSAVAEKIGVPGSDDRVTITTDIIYSYQGNQPPEDNAYWHQKGDRVTQSQDYVAVPDPIPGGTYTWVSNPLPQYTPNPPNPPLPGSPAFPGATDTYELEMRDSTGVFVVAVRVTVEKELVLATRQLDSVVVYKDGGLAGFPTKNTFEWDETSSTNLRYKDLESLESNTTYYLALQSATQNYQYPLTRFTTKDSGYVEFDIEVPTDNYLVRILDINRTIVRSYLKGDPYSFTYETPDNLFVRASGWWPIECSVSRFTSDRGFDQEKNLLRHPEPGTMDLTMKGDEGDPRGNTALQMDNKIRVYLAEEAAPAGVNDTYLFEGFIERVSTTYDVFGNAITNLSAVDSLSRMLNVNIPIYEYSNDESYSNRMYNVIVDHIVPATWGVSYDTSFWPGFDEYDGSRFPPEYRENVSSSEIFNELTEGEYGILIATKANTVFWFNRNIRAFVYAVNQDLVNEAPSFGFSTVHDADSLDHFCVNDFRISNSIEDITNKVNVSLSYDELTTATYSDEASISRYGERAYDVQLNLDAPDGDPSFEINKWAKEVPYVEDSPEFDSITASVISRKGYVNKAYLIDPHIDAVRVYIKTGLVDVNGVWFVNRVRHTITPDNWNIEVELSAD